MWDIEIRRQSTSEPSAHVFVRWDYPSTITNVSLEAGPKVRRTNFGGSTRTEMAEWTSPVQGIFRWDADLERPQAIIRWIDEDGDQREQGIDLVD